jgi:hypothetical protein
VGKLTTFADRAPATKDTTETKLTSSYSLPSEKLDVAAQSAATLILDFIMPTYFALCPQI